MQEWCHIQSILNEHGIFATEAAYNNLQHIMVTYKLSLFIFHKHCVALQVDR